MVIRIIKLRIKPLLFVNKTLNKIQNIVCDNFNEELN